MSSAAKAVAAVIAALLAAVIWQSCAADRADARANRAEARADSVAAAADSSRRLEVAALGDTMEAVTRRAIQTVDARHDEVDRALQRELGASRQAIANLTATVRALEARVSSAGPVAETPEGTRTARFEIAQRPFSGQAAVTLPPPPASGSLDLRLQVEPARIGLRLYCSPVEGSSFRRADAVATGPDWLTLELGEIRQEPAVCNRPEDDRPWWRRAVDRVGISAGYGVVGFTEDGEIKGRAGPSLQAGVRLWP